MTTRTVALTTTLKAVAVLSILLTCCPALPQKLCSAPLKQITILQLNDVYQISPVDKGKRGGLARVETMRKQIAGRTSNTLFLLAGDTISPSVASNIFKGRQIIDAWNAIHLDYAAFGNHEFDFGNDVLLQRLKQSKFQWINSNVIDKNTGKLFGDTPAYVIRDFDGVRVGILGILTPDTVNASKPGPNLAFLDPCETAARLIPEMRAKGAQIIVALTHLTMNEDKQLAHCAGIDITIGGHEHAVLESVAGKTPILKMGSDARNLGVITLNYCTTSTTLESIDWDIVPVTDQVKPDPQAQVVIGDYEKKISAELDKPVGRSSVELDARQDTNRNQETNLADYVADAYRKQTGARLAFLNGGSIRSNSMLPSGTLTRRDILTVLPFENPIVKIEIKGSTVRQVLEHGLSRIEDRENGAFPQISGMRIRYSPARPAGARLTSVEVDGKPLDDNSSYTLATNTYVINGGDGYQMLRDPFYLVHPEEGQVEPAVVMSQITKDGTIAPKVEGRIKAE